MRNPSHVRDKDPSRQAGRERPIIMSGDNPKLILDGRKTQTRRIVDVSKIKPSKWTHESIAGFEEHFTNGQQRWNAITEQFNVYSEAIHCPFGVAGDRLWVREAWFPNAEAFDSHNITDVLYRSDWGGATDQVSWRPSIHMPRWASRITLEITKVRVERLQDISEADAKAEGVEPCDELRKPEPTYRTGYRRLWNSLHGKGAWDKNPWGWVIEFRLSPRVNFSPADERDKLNPSVSIIKRRSEEA